MKNNNQLYLIGVIYRIPNTNIYSFIDRFNRLLEPLKTTHRIILLGDYNINLLKNDNHKNEFEMCLQSNYLMPTILSPTRVATKVQNGHSVTTETLIDNIFINYNMQYQSGIIETSITDHYSIFIAIPEIIKSTQAESITKHYRVKNNISQRKFNHLLTQSNISEILTYDNAKFACSKFFDTFENSYNTAFPIKTKNINHKDVQSPWVNEILINRIKIRNKLSKLAKKHRIDQKIYADFRNLLTSQLREAKSKYYEEQFKNNSNNIKKTWEIINSVIKSKNVQTKISLSDDEGKYYEDSAIPNKFIDYYSNIASQLTSKIAPTQKDAASYLKNRVQNSFLLTPVCPEEVSNIIDDLKDNGNNVNSIATSVLVDSKHIISPTIAHIIDLCIEQGYFPENLKTGCISPIFKGGDREKVNNYRPVCSLSPFSKIIEKVIYNRMISFLDKYKLLSDTQFGFRKNMSTETALLNYINYIHKQLDEYKHTISVFLDLSKAFDVIDHSILETKLEYYGFRGKFLEFLLSFIKDRQYFVHVNGITSDCRTLNIGVPQGSTLGPLLFLLYINDMISCSKKLFFFTICR